MYGAAETGTSWNLQDQVVGDFGGHPFNKNYAYVYWSVALFDTQSLEIKAFQAPILPDGGAPPTNPGNDARHWVLNQVDDAGNTVNSLPSRFPEDRQAKRIGFAGNDAILPRNKFIRPGGSTQPPRLNQLVRMGQITDEARTILAAEITGVSDYRAIGQVSGGGSDAPVTIKSHRPITPFVPAGGIGAASQWPDVYSVTTTSSSSFSFYYPEKSLYDQFKSSRFEPESGILDKVPPLALGQHYSGARGNYVFADGHVERLTPEGTFDRKLWGDRFYSITGPNRVFRGPWTEAE